MFWLCRRAIVVKSEATESRAMPRLDRAPFVRDTNRLSSDVDAFAEGKGESASARTIQTRAAAESPQRALPPLTGAVRYRTYVPGQVSRSHLQKGKNAMNSRPGS